MQHSDVQCNTASATHLSAEDVKQQRKVNRAKFLDRIRDSLGSVVQQMAFTPTEFSIVCGKSPTWGYRQVYRGNVRVVTSGGRILIPRHEVEHFLSGAAEYDPQPKKNGGENGNDNP